MGTLRHIVLFSFKAEASGEQVDEIVGKFLALEGSIDVVRGFEWGLNVSPEDLHQGLSHCFTITFDSLEDLDIYQNHPAHLAFVADLQAILDKVLVVDYLVNASPANI
ncbi:MAG: Dabb family protein [Chloroflexota bacterium]